MKVNGQRATYECRNGSLRSTKAGASQPEASEIMSPLMVPCWECQESACGWSAVQLDHDEELGPMHGMCGTLDAELEGQRTMKRAELTAFLCLLRKAIGNTLVHVDNKGIIFGLWRG